MPCGHILCKSFGAKTAAWVPSAHIYFAPSFHNKKNGFYSLKPKIEIKDDPDLFLVGPRLKDQASQFFISSESENDWLQKNHQNAVSSHFKEIVRCLRWINLKRQPVLFSSVVYHFYLWYDL